MRLERRQTGRPQTVSHRRPNALVCTGRRGLRCELTARLSSASSNPSSSMTIDKFLSQKVNLRIYSNRSSTVCASSVNRRPKFSELVDLISFFLVSSANSGQLEDIGSLC